MERMEWPVPSQNPAPHYGSHVESPEFTPDFTGVLDEYCGRTACYPGKDHDAPHAIACACTDRSILIATDATPGAARFVPHWPPATTCHR
jgi:hypothetical protein